MVTLKNNTGIFIVSLKFSWDWIQQTFENRVQSQSFCSSRWWQTAI